MLPLPRLVRAALPAAAAVAVAAVALTAPSPATGGTATEAGTAGAATSPSFIEDAEPRGVTPPAPRTVSGTSRLVTLRPELLPAAADGQRIGFDLGRSVTTGRVTRIDSSADFTAWTGTLDGGPGSFTVVRAGDLYQASLITPGQAYAITQAQGSDYWLTTVAPYAGPSEPDAAHVGPSGRATAPQGGARPATEATDRRGPRIDVLFGYTKAAKRLAGSKGALKAAMGQVVAETNSALAASGVDVKIRDKGLVKVRGKEHANPLKDMRRLSRPKDGHFDSAVRARSKRNADIVHLFTGGSIEALCGAGALPRTTQEATPLAGASVTRLQCLSYLVGTHELGHNLGADHISYPGVRHDSFMPGAYAWYDVPRRFYTVMGYPDPCTDAGVTCTQLAVFSNPDGLNGVPVGSELANNAGVIRKMAPLVAKYSRR